MAIITCYTGNINHIRDYKNRTPLYVAVEHNRMDVVDFLLFHSVHINSKCTYRELTALHIAAKNNHIDMIYKLLNNGADPNIGNFSDITPIMYAAKNLNFDSVKALTISSDLTKIDKMGNNILTYPIYYGSIEIVEYLLDLGLNINCVDRFSDSYLHIAAYQHQYDMYKFLISRGIDTHVENDEGCVAADFYQGPP